MTSEEKQKAIEELEILKEEYWDDDGYGHETKQYDDTMLALDTAIMAIQALEQEPKSEWEHDHEILKAYADGGNNVLDKVRAEIIELRSKQNVGVLECLDIIDKYKSESEG